VGDNFGRKTDEVTGGGRKLQNEELRDCFCLLDVIRVIECIGIRGAGHVALVGRRNTPGVLTGNPKGRHYLEDQGVDGGGGWICNIEKYDVTAWTAFNWLRIGTNGGLL
jgi:hypothetical protein